MTDLHAVFIIYQDFYFVHCMYHRMQAYGSLFTADKTAKLTSTTFLF